MPLRRRRGGLRAVHAEPLALRQPQIPHRAEHHEDRIDARSSPSSTRRAPTPTRRSPSPTASPSRWRPGTILTYTNVDQPVVYNGATFSASGPLVQGLKYKARVGLEVDKQQITIAARPTDLVTGAPFLNALRDGAFDGATVQRDRVFMTAIGGAVGRRRHAVPGPRFDGRPGRAHQRDDHGRVAISSSSTTTCRSNLYSPTCLHTLYDSGCGVIARNLCGERRRSAPARPRRSINFTGALREPRARLDRLHLRRQRQCARDGEERRRRRRR